MYIICNDHVCVCVKAASFHAGEKHFRLVQLCFKTKAGIHQSVANKATDAMSRRFPR